LSAAHFALSPHKGGGVRSVGGGEILNGRNERVSALEAGVVQGLALEDAEPNLDLVEPAGAGRREMKGDVRMLGEPVVILLMGVQVVQDDVDLPVSGLVRHNLVHKGLEVGALLGLRGLPPDDDPWQPPRRRTG